MPKDKAPTNSLRQIVIEIFDPSTREILRDGGWESCTGGGLNIATAHTTTPGHKYIDTLTLRGPLTAGRKALCQWITEVAQGKDSRRSVTIKEILKDGGAGKTYTYHECFPVRYAGPLISAERVDMYEEVVIQPGRFTTG